MNKIQNNKIPVARRPCPLVRVWRSTGGTGTPLVCQWVRDESAPATSAEHLENDRTGGLL